MDGSIGTLDLAGLRDDDADDSHDDLEGEEERQREVSVATRDREMRLLLFLDASPSFCS